MDVTIFEGLQGIDVLIQLIGGIGLQHIARGHVCCGVGVCYFALVKVEARKLCTRASSSFHAGRLKHELGALVG